MSAFQVEDPGSNPGPRILSMRKAIIALPLEDKELSDFADSLDLESVDSLPYHITLYSLEVKEKAQELIKARAEKLASRFLPIEVDILGVDTSAHKTARFVIKNTEKLQNFHESIIEDIYKLRDKDAYSKAKKFYHEYSDREKELINKYGRSNILENFSPHITIGRINTKIYANFNKKIMFRNIDVYYQ